MRRLIVVVGADGRQGGSVIDALLEYPDEWYIRGITGDVTSFHSQEFVRHGVDMVKFDINNREECCRAFVDAYGVFAITNYWDAINQDEHQQALNLVEAARAVNVQHFITSGLPNMADFKKSHFDLPFYPLSKSHIQEYLHQLPQTLIFPHITYIHVGFYYQNFITFFVPDSIHHEFRYPLLSHARIPLYDVRDTGKVIRECFRHPEIWGDGQVVPIVAEQLSMEEICTTIQEVTAKDIHFVPLSYEEALIKLHRETVNNLKWYNDFDAVHEHQAERTKEIWPKMNTFAEWVREIQWLME